MFMGKFPDGLFHQLPTEHKLSVPAILFIRCIVVFLTLCHSPVFHVKESIGRYLEISRQERNQGHVRPGKAVFPPADALKGYPQAFRKLLLRDAVPLAQFPDDFTNILHVIPLLSAVLRTAIPVTAATFLSCNKSIHQA